MKGTNNISDYASYFHDGSILDIHQAADEILISMESAELAEGKITDEVLLSSDQRLKGILHLKKPGRILINDKPPEKALKMLADSGEVLRFSVSAEGIQLFIEWTNYPPKNNVQLYTNLLIDAEEIFWENKPD